MDGETASALDRFLSLVRREMHAEDVRVLPPDAGPPSAENVLCGLLHDGRQVVVAFPEAPGDREALSRRLDMLLQTFSQSSDLAGRQKGARLPIARSLQDELRALAKRANAVDALVIDAHSPVVWGSAVARTEAPASIPSDVELVDVSRRELIVVAAPGAAGAAPAQDDIGTFVPHGTEPGAEDLAARSLRAIDQVRDLDVIDTLHKGGHLHRLVRDADFGYLAQSFASIYVLIVVFGEPFDELRAERAVGDSLPRIERRVMALPPLDPPKAPMAGVIAFRRTRRR